MKLENKIAKIMDNFDFHNVVRYMKRVGWIWGSDTPGVSELRARARNLLEEAARSENSTTMIATGGLQVNKFQWNENDVELQLQFVLEDWSE